MGTYPPFAGCCSRSILHRHTIVIQARHAFFLYHFGFFLMPRSYCGLSGCAISPGGSV